MQSNRHLRSRAEDDWTLSTELHPCARLRRYMPDTHTHIFRSIGPSIYRQLRAYAEQCMLLLSSGGLLVVVHNAYVQRATEWINICGNQFCCPFGVVLNLLKFHAQIYAYKLLHYWNSSRYIYIVCVFVCGAAIATNKWKMLALYTTSEYNHFIIYSMNMNMLKM